MSCAVGWDRRPLKALFDVVAGPLAQPHTPGVRFRGLRTVALDWCSSIKVPDTDDWTRLGFLVRAGAGIHTLATPP